ncbi:MAG: HAD-IG family 5'-nucleotidase [Nannocystaceae bacterium]|nr:HAD-IG family 5'-nucleotidase [Nannocystaceae bacterium]
MFSAADLPTPIRKALLDSGLETEAPPERRIFTNRDLNFDSISVIGFDMDYTLAIYRQEEIEAMSILSTTAKLIARGYPEKLREVPNDPKFAIRGLMVDRKLGNIIKMDRHGYVGRAYHGLRKLQRPERKAIYRDQRLGQERERFAAVDTLFALPEVTLFAAAVELIDREPQLWGAGGPPSYAETWLDVRECIDEAHRDGSIKDHVRDDPGRFIEADPDLARALHQLRSAGKKLFLLTNSLLDYTDVVMKFLLDGALPSYPDWTTYFDWMVVGASKPSFFTENAPFQELDPGGAPLGGKKQQVQRGKIYGGGNQLGLQASLGVHPDEVLYVGDHIYGDIVRSKKSSGWRTALVVQELEHELEVRRDWEMTLREIEGLHGLRARLADEIGGHRYLARTLARLEPAELVRTGLSLPEATAMLETTRADLRKRLDWLRNYEQETQGTLERRGHEVDAAFNPYWGSSFRERNDTSRFGAQVESFACIYTSRVSNLLFASPAKYFISPHGSMPHWAVGR